MPEYKLCLLKKDVQTNDDEIYNKIVGQGTTYYRYYAILEDGEEKYYVSKFEDAEDIVKQLKDKESTNSDKITILENIIQVKQHSQMLKLVWQAYTKKNQKW